MTAQHFLSQTIAGTVAVGLVAAAWGKLNAPGQWRAVTDLLPRILPVPIRILIPGLELVLAVAIVVFPRGGLLAAASFVVLLTAGVGVFYSRLSGAECACFGHTARGRVSPRLFVRNAIIVALLLGFISLAWRNLGVRLTPPALWVPALVATIGVLLVALRRARLALRPFQGGEI